MERPLMRGLLYSAARHRNRERHSHDEHQTQSIAVAVFGSIREIALVVAMIETADIEPVDLWLDPACRPLKSVLEQRTGIRRVLFSPMQSDSNDRPASQSGRLPVYGRYRNLIQIAALFRSHASL